MCGGQVTPSKIDKICPLAVLNQIFTISMHIPSLMKINQFLFKLLSGNEIMMDGGVDGQTGGYTDV